MDTNQYQDVNALLRSLSAYMPHATPLSQTSNVQHGTGYLQNNQGAVSSTSFASLQQPNSNQGQIQHPTNPLHLNNANSANARLLNYNATDIKTTQAQNVDPRDIIEWSVALRYVTRLIARHEENIGRAVRKMITNQHENEKQWWTGREALIEKQNNRAEGRKKLDEVLLAIGGQIGSQPTNEGFNDRELALYDLKVHKAATAMNEVMSSELAALGIPFFDTRPHLIVESRNNDDAGGTPVTKHITREELHRSKLRMLTHLEEMFNA